MTQRVTDEQLGKVAVKQGELFRRVKEGTLDPEKICNGLQWIIEGEFAEKETFLITVNYDQSLKQMIKAGNYDLVNGNITQEHFPIDRQGKEEVKIRIFPITELTEEITEIRHEKGLESLKNKGYRPINLPELLAFRAKYPDIQRRFPVIALGSVWQHCSSRGMAYLCRHNSRRGLSVFYIFSSNGRWGYFRIAAVLR